MVRGRCLEIRRERTADLAAVQLARGASEFNTPSLDLQVAGQIADDEGRESELIQREASAGAEIFRRRIRRGTRIEKWQHAAKKILAPSGIEPAIEFGGREMVC